MLFLMRFRQSRVQRRLFACRYKLGDAYRVLVLANLVLGHKTESPNVQRSPHYDLICCASPMSVSLCDELCQGTGKQICALHPGFPLPGRAIHGPMPVSGETFGQTFRAIGPYRFPPENKAPRDWSIQMSPEFRMDQWLPISVKVLACTGIGP